MNLFFLLVLQKQAAILKFFLSNTKFLDRALYARHEIVYCQQKFTNHCLIVLLENKSTEMLKILVQRPNFVFSQQDLKSFVSVCLQDYQSH